MARHEKTKIRSYIEKEFGYDLSPTPDEIRPSYSFDVTCQGSVPEAICCFLTGNDVEETIRLAISLNGDTDTQAAIASSIAEAYYKEIPSHIMEGVDKRLPKEMKEIVTKFQEKFISKY